ncbi:MAG: glycosyltransferase family 1 protein [Bacteroidetes bacterium]|nr:glycosyltransferase family 1 protein [Bacteroidota bacterium]
MKRLLIVGSNSKWAIEGYFVKYLNAYFEVSFFNAHGIYLDYYHKSLFNKIICRLNLSNILKELNIELIRIVADEKIDAILVFKGMEIKPSTLKRLKVKGVKLFNYNPDHPFEFFGRGSGNKFVKDGIKFYDHHFSYSKEIVKDLLEKYKVSASWLPFAYEQSKEPSMLKDIKAVCFIGNPDSERARIIKVLLEAQIPVHVYGNNWPSFLNPNSLLECYKAIYHEEFIEKAQAYRIQLNTFRPHNANSHNMRTFEMSALGCIVLAPSSQEHHVFFKHRKHVFLYQNEKEMIQLAKDIIDLNEQEALQLKWNAFHRCIDSGNHYQDRAELMASVIKKQFNS